MNPHTFLCLSVCMVIAACERAAPPEVVPQNIRPARIVSVEGAEGVIEHQFVGRVDAMQSVDLSFEVAGPLATLNVLEGQEIKAGSLVAALDAKDFELAVAEAKVELQLARQDLQRKQRVFAQRGIAKSAVEDAKSNFDLHRVRLEKAQQSLLDSRLYAPFDAYVARRYVDTHVNVQVNQPIARLHDMRRLRVVASVPEQILATSNADQVVALFAQFDFAGDATFPLEVYENRGDADAVAQTYEISLVMARPQQWNVLPGMTATIHVRLRDPEATAVAYIPVSALVSDAQKNFFVWRFNEADQSVTRQPVEVGPLDARGIPVISGLVGGEKIVGTGASQLQDGMRVRALEF